MVLTTSMFYVETKSTTTGSGNPFQFVLQLLFLISEASCSSASYEHSSGNVHGIASIADDLVCDVLALAVPSSIDQFCEI
ncbi:hypothetical protein ACH5RR_037284 [Cinchona calisaya]|uniref:Uncharacterized protein n=1 Tax=Cinchona calisaya TaxID=153742 RepID=A0ABD2Y758_9GENT